MLMDNEGEILVVFLEERGEYWA